jgi:HSP20 family molecular chaperone IbpA
MGLTPYVRVEDYVEDATYVVRAEMPGIDPDKDVEVNVLDDVLTVRGERKEERQDLNRHEFHYGSFERRLRLPRGTKEEDIKASYQDGVLELRIPFQRSGTPTAPRRSSSSGRIPATRGSCSRDRMLTSSTSTTRSPRADVDADLARLRASPGAVPGGHGGRGR